MSDYRAAAHVLEAPSIRERLAPFVRPPVGSSFAGAILWDGVVEQAQTFSDGEIMLVNAAYSLWSGRSSALVGDPDLHTPTIPHLLQWLDSDGVDRVLEAIGVKRGEGLR